MQQKFPGTTTKKGKLNFPDVLPLYGMVRRLALQANMPMPKVYIVSSAGPNAFATGRNPQNAAVAATEGILRILSPEELEGVMAHELAHVQNRDTLISTVAATFAGAISMLGSKLQQASTRMPMQEATSSTSHLFIVNPLTGALMLKLFSTHPPMEERIARLEAMAVSGE